MFQEFQKLLLEKRKLSGVFVSPLVQGVYNKEFVRFSYFQVLSSIARSSLDALALCAFVSSLEMQLR